MAPVEIATDERITAFGRLVEAQRRLYRIFDRSLRSEIGISAVWFEALLRLGRSEDHQMPITELGDQLVLTSGGATRLVDRLHEQGYIERVACPEDRRIQWAHLTDKGVEVLAAATALHLDDLEEHFASVLGPHDMDALSELLDKLRSLD